MGASSNFIQFVGPELDVIYRALMVYRTTLAEEGAGKLVEVELTEVDRLLSDIEVKHR